MFPPFPGARIAPDATLDKRPHFAAAAIRCITGTMADQLYDEDILLWAERQADLLRRLARGELVKDVDWEHVAGEIEDVGRSESHSVESDLRLILAHLLKLQAWSDDPSARHWRAEIIAFQQNLEDRFTPSMRQRINLARRYSQALEQLADEINERPPALALPRNCPFTLDQLLTEKRAVLEQRLSDATAAEQGPRHC